MTYRSLKMNKIRCLETSAPDYRLKQRHGRKERHFQLHCCESLKSRKPKRCSVTSYIFTAMSVYIDLTTMPSFSNLANTFQ